MRIESSEAPPPFTIERYAYDGDGTRRKRVDGNGTIHVAPHRDDPPVRWRLSPSGADHWHTVAGHWPYHLGDHPQLPPPAGAEQAGDDRAVDGAEE